MFKTVELNSNVDCNYDFLQDDIEYKLNEIESISNGFNEFKNINNIEINNNLYEFMYYTEKKDIIWIRGLTHCCTNWNTIIDWLWVKLPELYEHEKETRVFIDWKIQSKIIEKFYNFEKIQS